MELSVNGFMKVKKAVITGDGVHLITGGNGAGKTSLKASLLWLLTGKVEGLQADDMTGIVNDGVKEALVTLSDNGSILSRKRSATVSSLSGLRVESNGKVVNKSEAEALRMMGLVPSALSVYHYNLFTIEDISRLLLNCAIDNNGIKLFATDLEASEFIKGLSIDNITLKQSEVSCLLGNLRKQMMAYIDDDKEIPSKVVLKKGDKEEEVDLEGTNIEKSEKKLEVLKAERDELLKVHSGDMDEEGLAAEVKALENRFIDLSQLQADSHFLDQERALLQIMENADCPLFNMKCSSQDNKIQKVIEERKKRVEAVDSRLKGVVPEEVEREISEVTKLLDEKRALLGTIKAHPNAKEKLQKLDNTIRFAESIIGKARERNALLEERKVLAANAEKAKGRTEVLERLEAALALDGVIYNAIVESTRRILKYFEDYCGEIGLKVSTKGWISIDGRPLVAASESQRLAAWFAMQTAIAIELKLPFLICDQLDRLDPLNKGSLIRFARKVAGNFKAVFLFCYESRISVEDGKAYLKASPIPGVNSWWIEDGTLYRVDYVAEMKEAA